MSVKLNKLDRIMIMSFVHTLVIMLASIAARLKNADPNCKEEMENVRHNTITAAATIASRLNLNKESLSKAIKIADKMIEESVESDDKVMLSSLLKDIITPN